MSFQHAATYMLHPSLATDDELAEACFLLVSRAAAAAQRGLRIKDQDLEDCISEMTAYFYLKLRNESIRIESAPFGYVSRAVRRYALRILRTREDWQLILQSQLDQLDGVLQGKRGLSEESVEILDLIVRSMPLKQAQAVLLVHYHGLTCAQAAEVLGRPHSTV